jgi:WD40 repeat protein
LVTVGTDQHSRIQIVVWNIRTIIGEKSVIYGFGPRNKINSTILSSNSDLIVIARQTSEFDIKRIKFSPFDELNIVSCGRENIRFWRIRKNHLSGRPILLNEYSRGFMFFDVCFYSEQSRSAKTKQELKSDSSFAYAATNKGLLLKINCQNDQVLCAYQLHSPSSNIFSLCIHSGYCVTGADDNKLRIW